MLCDFQKVYICSVFLIMRRTFWKVHHSCSADGLPAQHSTSEPKYTLELLGPFSYTAPTKTICMYWILRTLRNNLLQQHYTFCDYEGHARTIVYVLLEPSIAPMVAKQRGQARVSIYKDVYTY